MGCDIHLFPEVKVRGDWHTFATPDVVRSYPFFSKLAGVRGIPEEEEPLAPERGLPPNVAIVTRLHVGEWKEDGHDWSWLSAEEIVKIAEWAAKGGYDLEFPPTAHRLGLNCGYFFGDTWGPAARRIAGGETIGPITDLRWVFWFDN